MAFLDLGFLEEFLDRFLLDDMCGVALLVVIVLILAAYVSKRRRWASYVDRYGEHLEGREREGFVRRMGRSMLKTNLSAIALLAVLSAAFLFTMAFVFNIIGDWVWLASLVMALAVLGIQVYLVYNLRRLPVLDEERYGYIHTFVEDLCDRYDMRVPLLKMDDNPDLNAFTTSFFGRGSVIVMTRGLLRREEMARVSRDHLLAIIGHEVGHIVNHDATIITVLNPLMMFVMAVKGLLELIVRGMVFFIVHTGRWGTRGVLALLVSVGLIILMGILLLYVGVYYVTFYVVALVVSLFWMLLSRQKEYAADLFGSLASGSRVTMGLALMELTREIGLEEVKLKLTKEVLEEQVVKGGSVKGTEEGVAGGASVGTAKPEGTQAVREKDGEQVVESVEEKLAKMSKEDRMAVYESIDVYGAVTDDPELLEEVSMRDSRTLCGKGLEAFTEEDLMEFAAFDYSVGERVRGLMLSHPLFGKRVRVLTLLPASNVDGKEG